MGAKIEIGGTIRRPQLTRLTEEFCVLAPSETSHFLELEDSEAHPGQFEALEAYLVGQGIPFDRASDGTYEHAPEIRKFRPGHTDQGNAARSQADRVLPSDHENRPMVRVSDVAKALSETKTWKELAARLTELCGLDVLNLPPLRVTETI